MSLVRETGGYIADGTQLSVAPACGHSYIASVRVRSYGKVHAGLNRVQTRLRIHYVNGAVEYTPPLAVYYG